MVLGEAGNVSVSWKITASALPSGGSSPDEPDAAEREPSRQRRVGHEVAHPDGHVVAAPAQPARQVERNSSEPLRQFRNVVASSTRMVAVHHASGAHGKAVRNAAP